MKNLRMKNLPAGRQVKKSSKLNKILIEPKPLSYFHTSLSRVAPTGQNDNQLF
jgi:hypothetical protein